MKRLAHGTFHSDDVAWIPWSEKRTMPFRIVGSEGGAWVKVLAREPETGAESLLYRFDPGWSAERIELTAAENALVWSGDLVVGDDKLATMCYSYRPAGWTAGPCSSEGGALVISYGGAENDRRWSKTPVPVLDTEAVPWADNGGGGRGAKMLRGDEENLDVFFLMRGPVNADENVPYTPPRTAAAHESPEEAFILEGRAMMYDGNIDAPVWLTKGSFVHRFACTRHTTIGIVEPMLTFSHYGFSPDHVGSHSDPDQAASHWAERWLPAYVSDSPAVTALREGRDPGLPRRW